MNRYYQRRTANLSQNSNILEDPCCPVSEVLGRRPRLAILVDQKGWAYHDKASEKARAVEDEWDVRIFFLNEKPVIDPASFDILFNFNHTPSAYDASFHGRLIKGLYSHYHHTANFPWQYVYRMVKHATVLVVANRKQMEEIRPWFSNCEVLPDGVDTEIFYPVEQREGNDIVAGWSGNPDRRLARKRVKRYYEVVVPACREAGIELKAARDLERNELRRLYNETDVVLIASYSEGNPLCFLEAAACGRTVIATAVGIIPEMIVDGVNGFLIDPALSDKETTRIMAERLRWCREHPAETRVMGAKLMERVVTERNHMTVGEAFNRLLNRVAHNTFRPHYLQQSPVKLA